MSTQIRQNESYRMGNFRSVDDTVLLHGVDLWMDDGEWSPSIPCLGPLMDLALENQDCKEFQWLCEDRKWVCIRVSA